MVERRKRGKRTRVCACCGISFQVTPARRMLCEPCYHDGLNRFGQVEYFTLSERHRLFTFAGAIFADKVPGVSWPTDVAPNRTKGDLLRDFGGRQDMS